MPMKISRWEGLYPRIQSAAKHIRCGFVCTGKLPVRSGRNGARSLVPLNRVYTPEPRPVPARFVRHCSGGAGGGVEIWLSRSRSQAHVSGTAASHQTFSH